MGLNQKASLKTLLGLTEFENSWGSDKRRRAFLFFSRVSFFGSQLRNCSCENDNTKRNTGTHTQGCYKLATERNNQHRNSLGGFALGESSQTQKHAHIHNDTQHPLLISFFSHSSFILASTSLSTSTLSKTQR